MAPGILPALVVHAGAGGVGLVSGAAALSVRKGGRLHRLFGTMFFVAMLTMSALGASIAFFLRDGITGVVGLLTFYLVATGWMTVRRRDGVIGLFEYAAFPIGLGIAGALLAFGMQAANGPAGGLAALAPFVFAAVAALAAALDLKMILRGGATGAQRIARHLWRLCAALFIAAFSFFIGQQKVMPAFVQGSLLLVLPEIAVLGSMIFWLFRVRFGNRFGGRARARASA